MSCYRHIERRRKERRMRYANSLSHLLISHYVSGVTGINGGKIIFHCSKALSTDAPDTLHMHVPGARCCDGTMIWPGHPRQALIMGEHECVPNGDLRSLYRQLELPVLVPIRRQPGGGNSLVRAVRRLQRADVWHKLFYHALQKTNYVSMQF